MDDKRMKAFQMGKAASEVDFEYAMKGLLSGHQSVIEQMNRERADMSLSFACALALTGKGTRLDPDGILAQKISDGINKLNMCNAEKDFVERVTPSPAGETT